MMNIPAIKLFAATALVLLVAPASFANHEGVSVLLDKAPWTVFNGTEGGQPVCIARANNNGGLFEIIGFKEIAAISAESTDWKFQKRTAEVEFNTGGSGFTVSNGSYFSNVVQILNTPEAVYALISTISHSDVLTLEIYDQDKQQLGSFPIAGILAALKKWKSCVDGL